MLNSLKSPVNTIFIMLGEKCNFNCKYCMQHAADGLHVDLPQEINPDIFEFIDTIQSKREKNIDMQLDLHFYGGEPLLYFDKIQEIVKKTKNMYIHYSFISNGYAITEKMVDFFNEHDFTEIISWDGNASKNTRRINVFSIPEKKKLLFKLNRLGVSAVHSAFTSPIQLLNDFQALSDEYEQIHKYHIYTNIDELFDTGVSDRDLFNIDFEKVSDEMNQLIAEYDNHIRNNKTNKFSAKDDYIKRTINRIDSNLDRNYRTMCSCGNGYSTINLDLGGTLYSCHNSSDILGTIYDKQEYLLNKLFQYDKTMLFEKTCKKCPVQCICHNGCKLMTKKVRKESYCKLKKAVFLPIIQYVLSFANKKETKK